MVVGQIMSFYMIKIPLVYGKQAVSQLLKVRERACCSKLGYFFNFLHFLFDYVVCYLPLTCLLSVLYL